MQRCSQPGGVAVVADEVHHDPTTEEGRPYTAASQTEAEDHFPLERLGRQEGSAVCSVI